MIHHAYAYQSPSYRVGSVWVCEHVEMWGGGGGACPFPHPRRGLLLTCTLHHILCYVINRRTCSPEFCEPFWRIIKPEVGRGLPISSWLVRSTGDNGACNWRLKWGPLLGLSP